MSLAVLALAFQAVGFSPDGWFAYREGKDMTIVNVRCAETDRCLRDTPVDKDDVCYCVLGADDTSLKKLKIERLTSKEPQKSLPHATKAGSVDVEILYRERGMPSIAPNGPRTPSGRAPNRRAAPRA